MERMYSIVWIAFIHIIATCCLYKVGLSHCEAKEIQGALYLESHGQGAHPAGAVLLKVKDQLLQLEYAAPLAADFKEDICYDIGAIWKVSTQDVSGSAYIESAKCDGAVDPLVHDPWQAVWIYLTELANRRPITVPITKAWSSTSEYQTYLSKAAEFDFTDFAVLAAQDCIGFDEGDALKATLSASCSIKADKRQGDVIDLMFYMVSDRRSKRWEIDRIVVK